MLDQGTELIRDGPPILSLKDYAQNADQALARQQFRPFSTDTLAAALFAGCSALSIKAYLQSHPRETVQRELDTPVRHHHVLAYAINRNDAECLRVLVEYGTNLKANAVGDIPLLAYVAMRTKWTVKDATEVFKTLLVHGADSCCIPQDMLADYIKTPTAEPISKPVGPSPKWCTPERRVVLAETLNLTMRYYLWRSQRLATPSKRTLQVAKAHQMTDFLKVPFQIIGQEPATNLVLQSIFNHVALRTTESLVLAFAGLSGHGKTELANQMVGSLLSVPFLELDCTQMGQIEALLGFPRGYEGWKAHSPFNDFVLQNSGQRCVVFLDEFDKTKMDVDEALLKVMDTCKQHLPAGMYRDRKTNLEVDASQTIWILATNMGDTVIDRYHSKHIAPRKDADIDKISIEPLQHELLSLFSAVYSPAIAGRIDEIVPFIPFSRNEQAVVAHKFILDMQGKALRPIDIEKPHLHFINHAHIAVIDDGKLCQHIAKTGYVKELGARSIKRMVKTVRRRFASAYLGMDGEITDQMNKGPLVKFVVQLHPIEETDQEVITVVNDGFTVVAGSKRGGK
ncbi:hypothetical protein LTR17_004613 [Elasticomyces elasticus]|nr:hypothetical protein LTR17_004613 [Elasticomyces elasticus]